MENTENEKQVSPQQWVQYTANLLVNENKYPFEVKKILMEKGLDEITAETLVDNVAHKIKEEKKSGAQKDILWGAVWCVGGIVLTVADIGYIFWGAIIFGGIQLIKGISNA